MRPPPLRSHIECVVGEEAAIVERVAEHLRDCGAAHVGVVVVAVRVDAHAQRLVQRVHVRVAAASGHDAALRQHLGARHVAAEDRVPLAQTRVGANHGKVGARQRQRRAAVQLVGRPARVLRSRGGRGGRGGAAGADHRRITSRGRLRSLWPEGGRARGGAEGVAARERGCGAQSARRARFAAARARDV